MEAVDIRPQATTDNDRLLITLLLAGLFHLIVILGVTFVPDDLAGPGSVPSIEVMLVNDSVPASTRNEDAAYLAQRTQQGSGNLDASGRSRIPGSAGGPFDMAGMPDGSLASAATPGNVGGQDSVIAATAAGDSPRYIADADTPAELPASPLEMRAGPAATLPSNEDDAELRLRGAQHRELLVTASTRESVAAVYLDGWRRKVERLGTLNFPDEARRKDMTGNPIVEVALRADGSLVEVVVRRSSGHPELDQAAVQILRLASPFDPFPRDLALRHDRLRFAYEWQFISGRLAGSAVSVPDRP
jgi:protein TonB